MTQQPAKLSLGENLLLVAWALVMQGLAATVIAPTILLIWRYGPTRVLHEHLRILAMPKHGPWPVSNGDTISNLQFAHYLIGLACWFALIFATYPLIRLVVPWRRRVPRR